MKIIALLFLSFFLIYGSRAQGSKNKTLESVLLKNSIKHHFSDPQKEDTFLLTVTGNSLLHAKVIFEIIDFRGKQIYQDTFTSNYLFNYSLEENAMPEIQKLFIEKRVKEFFIRETFLTPAIKKLEKFDQENNVCKKDIWQEIKSDPNRTGFYYLVGEENGRRIAYSKKLKKVVAYFSCC